MQNPAAIASLLFPKLVYGAEHPYGRANAGTLESITALSAGDLKSYHDAYYKPNASALIRSPAA